MRRTHAARTPSQRRRLAFEPLEPRELLAADTGFDWWSASDFAVDDWAWTFDDASTFDPGGEAWWDDSWWVDDVSWDASAADGTDSGSVDLGGSDAAGWDVGDWNGGGVDWSTDVGGPDAGWTGDVDSGVDIVMPPAPDVAGDTPDDVNTMTDVVGPPSHHQEVVVVAPGVESPADPSLPVGDSTAPPVVVEPEAEGAGEPPIISPPTVVVHPDFTGEGSTVICILLPAADETSTDVAPAEGSPTDDAVTVDAIDDMTDMSWVFDSPLADGVPSPPTDGSGSHEDSVVDVTADDSVVPPTIVIVTPITDRPAPPVAVSPVPVRSSVTTSPAATRFAGWGSFFFQAFGRPDGDIDGASVGGQAGGQPGTGRPRLRLPFRPLV